MARPVYLRCDLGDDVDDFDEDVDEVAVDADVVTAAAAAAVLRLDAACPSPNPAAL